LLNPDEFVRVCGLSKYSPWNVWPDVGVTKKDLAEYYVSVWDWIEPQIRSRALSLVRAELASLGVKQPELVSVDLDGNDYHITEALLGGGLRPALWISEYNARFSADTRWVMPYDPQHRWQGTDYYGASLAAWCALFARVRYRLVCCNANGVNAFFVSEAHAGRFADIAEDCATLYMPANFRAFPYAGHPQDLRVIAAALAAAPNKS